MGFYSNVILPWGMDWVMSQSPFPEYRQAVLSEVSGDVLEIGFGTGLNLLYYPDCVETITMIDRNSGMKRMAEKRIKASSITIDTRILNGEKLPMQDESFDSVVSTWTLCSIVKVEQAIAEIKRVLKPNGKFHFIEHGLSDDSSVQKWQHRLTPWQKRIGDGCHLNRPIRQLIEQEFETVQIKEFCLPNISPIVGYTYQGIAIKTAKIVS